MIYCIPLNLNRFSLTNSTKLIDNTSFQKNCSNNIGDCPTKLRIAFIDDQLHRGLFSDDTESPYSHRQRRHQAFDQPSSSTTSLETFCTTIQFVSAIISSLLCRFAQWQKLLVAESLACPIAFFLVGLLRSVLFIHLLCNHL